MTEALVPDLSHAKQPLPSKLNVWDGVREYRLPVPYNPTLSFSTLLAASEQTWSEQFGQAIVGLSEIWESRSRLRDWVTLQDQREVSRACHRGHGNHF